MDVLFFYLLAFTSLVVGLGALMTLIERFPLRWLYYHYFIRKPTNVTILVTLIIWSFVVSRRQETFPRWSIAPIVISCVTTIMAFKLHQEKFFQAADYPEMTTNLSNLPLTDEMRIAVVEYEGVTKCYPLDYVIHHHVVNDKFKTKIVALTYCAMCRTVIPFDVTDIGPLFVGSFKNANMILADRKTKTFFQQASFKSIIGKLHPSELNMVSFQILPWSEVKNLEPTPQVAKVTSKDLGEFQFPTPGLWKRILRSEKTPGLSSKSRDQAFPARTDVIGIIDDSYKEAEKSVYLKKEVMSKRVVVNKERDFFLIGVGNSVNAFKNSIKNAQLKVSFDKDKSEIVDSNTATRWDILGKYKNGVLNTNLKPIAISDEYWFSWKKFHKKAKLVRL
ncbi:hypothetical protein M0812_19951 [Anaeramoeba flamelloides]|uniref:DUF3179 domain-containing protein n=1 Tax=Anaeramoeba flamelloides TaxID=1746091 RepID=A0AAV7YYK6_9EUKA|nr:hypothetical protein M0812_19951 [Anaeramoeba flamelloides]